MKVVLLKQVTEVPISVVLIYVAELRESSSKHLLPISEGTTPAVAICLVFRKLLSVTQTTR